VRNEEVAAMARRTPTGEIDGEERMVDVRGPRFSAAITVAVLATAIVLELVWLVALQVGVFALATIGGLSMSPYGALFRFVKERADLGPPPEVEPEGPPRFAQAAGLAFAAAGLVALLLGAELLGWVLVGIVAALAALLAFTGLCVGCELYLAGQRLRARSGDT
jgi:hypothetical protein